MLLLMGILEKKTVSALKAYQLKTGLDPDGVAGIETLRALKLVG